MSKILLKSEKLVDLEIELGKFHHSTMLSIEIEQMT